MHAFTLFPEIPWRVTNNKMAVFQIFAEIHAKFSSAFLHFLGDIPPGWSVCNLWLKAWWVFIQIFHMIYQNKGLERHTLHVHDLLGKKTVAETALAVQ